MSFLEKLKKGIKEGNIPYIFNTDDLKNTNFLDSEIKNISNFDRKNIGSSNKNSKVLFSREISEKRYYSLDEKLFT